jgi:periplasmic divalent cation tolerance protein
MSDELIVLVTTPEDDTADRIADALVKERLAACVNIMPGIHSVYRWKGEVARDRESLMIIKTTAARYADLEARVKQLHSYTTPEVIAVRIDRGSAEYLDWLAESTTS